MRKIVWLLFLSMLLLFCVSLPAWADGTTVGPVPEKLEVDIGEEFNVPVEVKDVSGLMGVSFELSFDPQKLAVIDADLVPVGIQVSSGSVFDGKGDLQVWVNKVDNLIGNIKYTNTVLSPASAFSGTGSIVVINFKAKAAGTAEIKFNPDSTVAPGGIELAGQGGDPIPANSFSATVKVKGETEPEKRIEVTLTNAEAVNTSRPLGIKADAYENSNLVPVDWEVKIKNEKGEVIETLTEDGETFNGQWTPTDEEISSDLPITKNYQVEVKATYADNVTVTETVDFTLSNYDLVIKKIEYANGEIKVTVENLTQAQKTADCFLQISKADGTFFDLNFKSENLTPGENTIEFLVGLSAGSYQAEVFLFDLTEWKTLSNPKKINFTV